MIHCTCWTEFFGRWRRAQYQRQIERWKRGWIDD